MERFFRLAQLMGNKYGLMAKAEPVARPLPEVISQIKNGILRNFENWVMGKYRALEILANQHKEPHAKALYDIYSDLVENIDAYSPVQMFNRINKILGLIASMKNDPKIYRSSIHDSVKIRRESDKNYREQLKSGFETNLKNISFGLEKAAKVLKAFVPEQELAGGAVEPIRKALSKEKLLMFMKTPVAQSYGLDDMDVMTRLLQYPELREKITTLINSIDRGHLPLDGSEVAAEAAEIKRLFDQKATTNLPFFEAGEDKAKQMSAPLEDDFEKESNQKLQKILRKYQ
jgi:hypothetical protein